MPFSAETANDISIGFERPEIDLAGVPAKILTWITADAQFLQFLLFAGAGIAAWLAATLFVRYVTPALGQIEAERVQRVSMAGRGLGIIALWGIGLLAIAHMLADSGRADTVCRVAGTILLAFAVIRWMTRMFIPMRWSRPAAVVLWAFVTLEVTGLRAPFVAILDDLGVSFGDSRISALSLAKSIFVLSAGLLSAGWLSRTIEGRLDPSAGVDPAARLLVTKLSKLGIVALVVVLAIQTAGIDLTVLGLFGGALGLGLGFGLQKVISNLVSGFILILDRSLKPGDVIQIDALGGQWGWVEKLGARYTTVRSRDGTETLIPNETLITSPVTNWSFSDKSIRVSLPVGVAYTADVEKAMALCLEAADAVERVLKSPKPNCFLIDFGDSAVNLELRFWIEDPEDGLRNVRSAVNLEIWKRFRANDIEIPYPQRDLHLRSAVPVIVKSE